MHIIDEDDLARVEAKVQARHGIESVAGKAAKLKQLPYAPRKPFMPFHQSDKRWACLVCHRRAGKTVASIRHLERAALTLARPNPRFAYFAPLLKQAKDVAWQYLKDGALGIEGATINESELRVDYPNGGRVRIYGADNPDALRGLYLDGVVLDEHADMRPEVWESVIRPALADRQGWAVFIGTPKGRNLFYEIYRQAQANPDEWFSLMLKASESGLLLDEELAAARQMMDESTYLREFECSFDEPDVAQFIATRDCLDAVAREEAFDGPPLVMGVDVARFGDDRSSIVIRRGDTVADIRRLRVDTMQLVGHVITEILHWAPQQVFVDGVGVGGGVVDRLRQQGYRVVDVSAGTRAMQADRYANLRAEMWGRMREWLRTRGRIPNDQRLIDDLVSPLYSYDASNRVQLEKKADMKKRGLPSPDSGDALALTFAFPVPERPALGHHCFVRRRSKQGHGSGEDGQPAYRTATSVGLRG